MGPVRIAKLLHQQGHPHYIVTVRCEMDHPLPNEPVFVCISELHRSTRNKEPMIHSAPVATDTKVYKSTMVSNTPAFINERMNKNGLRFQKKLIQASQKYDFTIGFKPRELTHPINFS